MDADAARDRRLVENEVLFRGVNEATGATAARLGSDQHLYEFMCECSDPSCGRRIRLTLGEYESVRSRGDQFALISGHEDERIERIVEHHDRYEVVQKTGLGADVARHLDRRDS
jgi:hypothetical protein